MPKRGGYRGGVKPTLPDDKKRASLSCRVAPEIKAWLSLQKEQTGESLGELVDIAVLTLVTHSIKEDYTLVNTIPTPATKLELIKQFNALVKEYPEAQTPTKDGGYTSNAMSLLKAMPEDDPRRELIFLLLQDGMPGSFSSKGIEAKADVLIRYILGHITLAKEILKSPEYEGCSDDPDYLKSQEDSRVFLEELTPSHLAQVFALVLSKLTQTQSINSTLLPEDWEVSKTGQTLLEQDEPAYYRFRLNFESSREPFPEKV